MSDYKKLSDMDEFYKLLAKMKEQAQRFYENGGAIAVYSFDNMNDRDSICDFLSNWAFGKFKTLKLYRDHNHAGDEYYLVFVK